jgi:transglutaminase-like putative cysteine protease
MAIHRANREAPRTSGPRTYALAGIPEGVDGTIVTLDIMRGFVKRYRTDPHIVELARSIIADLPGKAFAEEAARLQNYVRDTIRYTQDVYEVETLQTPPVTLQSKQGDCDDQATLLATLLNAAGHEARFVAVGFSPDNFEHVLVETKVGAHWVPVETTEPVRMGEYPWKPGEVLTRINRAI